MIKEVPLRFQEGKNKTFKFEKFWSIPQIRSALRICGIGGKFRRLYITIRQKTGLFFIRVKTNLKSKNPVEN